MSAFVEILPQLLVMSADSSDDSGGIWALLAAGPAAGAAMYGALYRYYRNTDKSHDFEHETRVITKPVQGGEHKVDEIKGTRDRHTKGRNDADYRRRVHRI